MNSGMEESRYLSDRTASSNSQIDAVNPWTPTDSSDYLQVNFASPVSPTSVLIQEDDGSNRITSFSISYRPGDDTTGSFRQLLNGVDSVRIKGRFQKFQNLNYL